MPGGIQREIPRKWSLEGGTPPSPHRPAPLPSPSQGPALQGVGALVLKPWLSEGCRGFLQEGQCASSRVHHGGAAVPLGKAGLVSGKILQGDLLENVHLLHPGQQKLLGEAVLGPFFQLRWIT
uniref:Uncharacterized protein n=1 Tax=Pan paniscus TaxID=9597 RepID=A0A2R9BIE5_PANPA